MALSRVLLAVFLKSFNQLHDEVPELCYDWFRGMQNFRIPVVPSYAHSYADVLGVSKNYEPVSCIKIKITILFLQGIIKDMIENPEKYPLTPVKVPIENPYYVPKPVSVESLKLMQNLSSLRKSKSQNSVKLMYDNKKKSGPSKSFWVKKSFRNPVALSSAAKKKKIVKTSGSEIDTNVNQEDDLMSETEMEKRWPRKKAYVNFANEIFVDEIKDLNDKSTGHLANFMHDVTDLYKFISPRFRRGTSL